MIEFKDELDNFVELECYSDDCTLNELINRLADLSEQKNMCRKCGKCCLDLIPLNGLEIMNIKRLDSGFTGLVFPDKPNVKGMEKSIHEMMNLFDLPKRHAEILHEYNTAEPIYMNKEMNGQCISQNDNLCAKYSMRPLICRLYHCKTGKKLSGIREIIISQGIWHSYYIMGWIDKSKIKNNPFLNASAYDEILLKQFDYPFDEINEKISYLL